MTVTAIEWCDATWNPVRGCARVSPGRERCYAERQALVRLRALALRALLEGEPGDDANSLLIAPSEVLTCVDEALDEAPCPSAAATFCSCPAFCVQPNEDPRDKSRTR